MFMSILLFKLRSRCFLSTETPPNKLFSIRQMHHKKRICVTFDTIQDIKVLLSSCTARLLLAVLMTNDSTGEIPLKRNLIHFTQGKVYFQGLNGIYMYIYIYILGQPSKTILQCFPYHSCKVCSRRSQSIRNQTQIHFCLNFLALSFVLYV